MSETTPDTAPRRRLRRASAGLILAGGLLVAGCGDDAGSDVRNITEDGDGGASSSGSASGTGDSSESGDASETSDTTTASESGDASETSDATTGGS